MPRCITHCTQFSFFVPFLCFTSSCDTCSCTAVLHIPFSLSLSLSLSSENRYNATSFFFRGFYIRVSGSHLRPITTRAVHFSSLDEIRLSFIILSFSLSLSPLRRAFVKHDVSKETETRTGRTRIRKARLIGGNKCETRG